MTSSSEKTNNVDPEALFRCITDPKFFKISISISFSYFNMSPSLRLEGSVIGKIPMEDHF